MFARTLAGTLEWPWTRRLWVAFLILPPFAFMATFVAYPIMSALAFAFYDWQGLQRGAFVGVRNFVDVLANAPYAENTWRAFRHNAVVFLVLLLVQNGVGFLLAYALAKDPRGYKFHRVAVFLPVILSSVIVALLWKQFLHPNFGLVNKLLGTMGLSAWAKPWLGLDETALIAIILVNAWHWIGFPTLVFLAGIQRIPPETIEAARIDGASEWQMMRLIIWPLVAPSMTVTFVLLFIGAFNWFELPYLMAGIEGSPYQSTDVLGLLFYRTAFGTQSTPVQDFGHGSALAAIMFLFVATVSAAATLWLRKRELLL